MKVMRILLLPLLLMAFGSMAVCQEGDPEPYRFPDEVSYSKAKIYRADNTRFEVKNLTINKDHLTYKLKGSSSISECELQDVAILKASVGSNAGRYALYGGLVMGLSAALALAQAESDPYTDVDINTGLWIGGFTAGGVLLGGLIGSTQTRWETIYINEQAHLFQPVGLVMAADTATGHMRVGLQFAMSKGDR
jgi:hypothetical protein